MTQTKTLISDIYKQSGIMYIRFDAEIDNKPNGQKNIGGAGVASPFANLKNSPNIIRAMVNFTRS